MFLNSLLLLSHFMTLGSAQKPECQDAQRSMYCAATVGNQTLFTPEMDGVPEGVFVALGLPAISALANFLELEEMSSVEVKHLLLSDTSIQDQDTDYGYQVAPTVPKEHPHDELDLSQVYGLYFENDLDTPEEVFEVRYQNAKISRELGRQLRDNVKVLNRILNRTAPTLETLSFIQYIPPTYDQTVHYHAATIFSSKIPNLKALTIRYPSNHGFGAQAPKYPPFSSLTHLHVVNSRVLPLSNLTYSSPSISHLRLSGISDMDDAPRELMPQWTPPPTLWDKTKQLFTGPPPPPPSPLPPNTTLIIYPGFSPVLLHNLHTECGTPYVAYDEMIKYLGETDDNLHVGLPSEQDFSDYGYTRGIFPVRTALAEFEDRVKGGDGEWRLPARFTYDEYWWRGKRADPVGTEGSEL